MNYIGNAMAAASKNRNVKEVRLEEQAAMYMVWLIAPSSAEMGRQMAMKLLKTAKFATKKAARDVNRHCQKMEKMIAGDNGGTEELDIYDGMLDTYRQEMMSEEANIRDCALEHYADYEEKEALAEILFCFSIAKVHCAIAKYENMKLSRMHSLLTIRLAEENLQKLVNLLGKLGYEYEKKNGVKEPIYDAEFKNDMELAVVGMKDALTFYYDKLLQDTDMHARIQRPLIEFEKKRDEKADAVGKEILSIPIETLGIESPVFKRYDMKTIQDLYDEEGMRKDLDWTEDEKSEIVKALQSFVKAEVLKYV